MPVYQNSTTTSKNGAKSRFSRLSRNVVGIVSDTRCQAPAAPQPATKRATAMWPIVGATHLPQAAHAVSTCGQRHAPHGIIAACDKWRNDSLHKRTLSVTVNWAYMHLFRAVGATLKRNPTRTAEACRSWGAWGTGTLCGMRAVSALHHHLQPLIFPLTPRYAICLSPLQFY